MIPPGPLISPPHDAEWKGEIMNDNCSWEKKEITNEAINPSPEDKGVISMNNAFESYHILSCYFYEHL